MIMASPLERIEHCLPGERWRFTRETLARRTDLQERLKDDGCAVPYCYRLR